MRVTILVDRGFSDVLPKNLPKNFLIEKKFESSLSRTRPT